MTNIASGGSDGATGSAPDHGADHGADGRSGAVAGAVAHGRWSSERTTAHADTAAALSPLIDVQTLADDLASPQLPVVVDVRWTLAGSDPDAYRSGHVPGAVFVDLDCELTAPPGVGGRHPLPDAAVLAGLFRRAGVHDDSAVVICGERDVSIAARAWWLLRWAGLENVRVVDGGFAAWQAAGLPVDSGMPADPGGGTAGVHLGGMPTVDADGAADLAAAADSTLLDARAPERYRGDTEPVDPVPGHIPGAVNVPLATVHRSDGRLLDAASLAAVFATAGVADGASDSTGDGAGDTAGDDVSVAASCGSGVTACALILAGRVAGHQFALYPGSYSGWCALGRDVEVHAQNH